MNKENFLIVLSDMLLPLLPLLPYTSFVFILPSFFILSMLLMHHSMFLILINVSLPFLPFTSPSIWNQLLPQRLFITIFFLNKNQNFFLNYIHNLIFLSIILWMQILIFKIVMLIKQLYLMNIPILFKYFPPSFFYYNSLPPLISKRRSINSKKKNRFLLLFLKNQSLILGNHFILPQTHRDYNN